MQIYAYSNLIKSLCSFRVLYPISANYTREINLTDFHMQSGMPFKLCKGIDGSTQGIEMYKASPAYLKNCLNLSCGYSSNREYVKIIAQMSILILRKGRMNCYYLCVGQVGHKQIQMK